jgi:hypothetical protein
VCNLLFFFKVPNPCMCEHEEGQEEGGDMKTHGNTCRKMYTVA